MNLIDFILENIYFVVIVLFAIISMLSKSRGKTSQEGDRRSAPGMPPYGGNVPQTESPQQHTSSQVEMKRQESALPASPVPQTTSMQEIEERIAQLRDTGDQLGEVSNVQSSSIDRPNSEASARKWNNPYKGNVTADEVIKGKMWSEVFGPPRAKNPYRANIRHHANTRR